MERKIFSNQFKEEAVHVMESGDKSPIVLAGELGIDRNPLNK